MTVLTVGPFNRVEGDLEVHLEVEDGSVRSARVNSTLFRGFEQMMLGKTPEDALVITPRICGICSVSQSMAAAYALADAWQLRVPRNGELATNLILAAENVADHLTHFYLFFMPDFARECYRDRAWFDPIAARFKALSGSAAAQVVSARTEFLHLMGILAGKWPHTLTLQPGGSSRAIERNEQVRLLAIVRRFRGFVEKYLFGDDLNAVLAIDSSEVLRRWMDARAVFDCDFRAFLEIADELDLTSAGRTNVPMMSYGVYPFDGKPLFARGVWRNGLVQTLDARAISEDISHTWVSGPELAVHPAHGSTQPDETKPNGYSWCKAPRLAGAVMEVGAVARQAVDGQPLVNNLVTESGGNVRNRVIARLLEVARLLLAMEQWLAAIDHGAPYCAVGRSPAQAEGVGLTESARGSLGHWLRIDGYRIQNYQIIAPTTWNFSPRDQHGVAGALEQALVGTSVKPGERDPIRVQHIVRSFDPCMVCTVH